MTQPGESDTPRTLADRAAAAAIDAAVDAAPIKAMVVLIHLAHAPPGEPDGSTSAHGIEPVDLLRWSLTHLEQMAEATGQGMVVLPGLPSDQ